MGHQQGKQKTPPTREWSMREWASQEREGEGGAITNGVMWEQPPAPRALAPLVCAAGDHHAVHLYMFFSNAPHARRQAF